MLKAVISHNEQATIVELPMDRLSLQYELSQIGIRRLAKDIPIMDEEDQPISVKLYSESDIGQNLAMLFRPSHSLEDANVCAHAVVHARPEVQDEIEQSIVYGQYHSPQAVLADIKAMTTDLIAVTVNYYCPLQVRMTDEEYGDWYEVDNGYALDNKRAIRELLQKEQNEEINNIVKVVNWIVDNSEEEVIAMIDDDMNDLIYRLDFNEKITDPEVITSELERIAQLMVDLDIGYGAVDASIAPWNYAQEFTFAGTSGGLRWFNKKVYKARFDEKIGYCCDTDAVLQELLKNRIILKPKYLCSHGATDVNSGGNSQKTRNDQIASFELMKHKWGKYFDYQLKTNKIYVRVRR